jgi:hypothetical protein
MKEAIALKSFSSTVYGNIVVGDRLQLQEHHFELYIEHKLIKPVDIKILDVAKVEINSTPTIEKEQTLEVIKSERDILLEKAKKLNIKVDARWSNKRLHKVLDL